MKPFNSDLHGQRAVWPNHDVSWLHSVQNKLAQTFPIFNKRDPRSQAQGMQVFFAFAIEINSFERNAFSAVSSKLSCTYRGPDLRKKKHFPIQALPPLSSKISLRDITMLPESSQNQNPKKNRLSQNPVNFEAIPHSKQLCLTGTE